MKRRGMNAGKVFNHKKQLAKGVVGEEKQSL